LVGLVEWACLHAVNPYLDWSREQTVGTHISLSHTAATPPGLEVLVRGTLSAVTGRKLSFRVSAHDGLDTICAGEHERVVVDAERFSRAIASKREGV